MIRDKGRRKQIIRRLRLFVETYYERRERLRGAQRYEKQIIEEATELGIDVWQAVDKVDTEAIVGLVELRDEVRDFVDSEFGFAELKEYCNSLDDSEECKNALNYLERPEIIFYATDIRTCLAEVLNLIGRYLELKPSRWWRRRYLWSFTTQTGYDFCSDLPSDKP